MSAAGVATRPVLIRGGRIVDPSRDLDEVGDVLLADGRVEACGGELSAPDGAESVDAAGLVVAPAFTDLHVHLREPGGEHKETIRTGARAAAAGGFAEVWAMPNTDPPVDDPAAVGFVAAEGERAAGARVRPVGAATRGQEGDRMTEIGELVAAGAVAVSDDGRPIASSRLMRRILQYTRSFGIPVLQHAEDLELAADGVMNEGRVATSLGLRGIPAAAESTMVARDVELAEITRGHLHVCHVSTRRAVEQIRIAKDRGARVTAEVTPHHLALTDEACLGYRTDAKVNPPLRSAEDRRAVRTGLADGTLDVVATDHAPHHYEEKEREFDDAPFGLVGLETAFAVCVTELVEPGILDLATLLERMSTAPARIMDRPGGTLRPGAPADVVILDPEERWTVEPADFESLGRNTPFAGRELRGRVRRTFVDGITRHRTDGAGDESDERDSRPGS